MKLSELFEADYSIKDPIIDVNPSTAKLEVYGKKLASFIKKNCESWLSQTENGRYWVYRGTDVNPHNTLSFIRDVRPNRIPKDTPIEKHHTFNGFIKQAGKVANRSNSLFVTGDKAIASDYGNPFTVLPIGNFNYTWNSEIKDWTEDYDVPDEMIYFRYKNVIGTIFDYPTNPEAFVTQNLNTIKGVFIKLIDTAYKTRKSYDIVSEYIEKIKEATPQSLKYILGDLGRVAVFPTATCEQVFKPFMTNLISSSVNKHILGDDGTLTDAILSQHEIMLYCKSALYINNKMYEYHILPLLGKSK